MRRDLIIGAGWLVAVATAAGIGMATISALGSGTSAPATQPVSAAEISRQLAELGSASPSTPTQTPPPSSAASTPAQEAAHQQVITTKGGTVLASCTGPKVRLLAWSPAQGFHVDGSTEPGPGTTAKVKFSARHSNEFTVVVTCLNGRPNGSVQGGD